MRDVNIGSLGTIGAIAFGYPHRKRRGFRRGARALTVGAVSSNYGTLNVQNGGVFTSGSATAEIAVGQAGTIAIAGGTFNADGDMTLNGLMTRDATGIFHLAAGRTLTVQGGGDATITGTFANTTASTIAVTGAGSTFTTTGSLSINSGSTLAISSDGDVSAGSGTINIGTGGNGTVTVAGTGSSLTGGTLQVGLSGGTGTLTFDSSSTGTFTGINVSRFQRQWDDREYRFRKEPQ